MTTLSDAQALLNFTQKAARDFSEHPTHMTYSEGSIPEAGDFLGLRWGPDGDCVKVVKLDENFTPVQYDEACLDGLDAGKLLQLVLTTLLSRDDASFEAGVAALKRYCEPYQRRGDGK